MPASSSNNQHLVGTVLAQAVAKRLQSGEILAYQHRDYCGIGLCFSEGVFVCGEVYDGSLGVTAWGGSCEHQTFATQTEFVRWLAKQSDESLSGKQLKDEFQRENQRLSIARLQEFVAAFAKLI